VCSTWFNSVEWSREADSSCDIERSLPSVASAETFIWSINFTGTYICIYVCMYVCMYVSCMCVCIFSCVHVCMYVCMYNVCMCIYTHVCVYIRMHACIGGDVTRRIHLLDQLHRHLHTHTHTHTHNTIIIITIIITPLTPTYAHT